MIQAMLTLIIRAVTSGKVSINLMRKQSVAIPAGLGIITDVGRSALLEKPL
jgi:hypothetical protein